MFGDLVQRRALAEGGVVFVAFFFADFFSVVFVEAAVFFAAAFFLVMDTRFG